MQARTQQNPQNMFVNSPHHGGNARLGLGFSVKKSLMNPEEDDEEDQSIEDQEENGLNANAECMDTIMKNSGLDEEEDKKTKQMLLERDLLNGVYILGDLEAP
jgi:hypothetical protein